jgi:hypothetical protein
MILITLPDRSTTTDQLIATLSDRIEQARKSDMDKARYKANQDDHLRTMLMQIANTPQGAAGGGGLSGFGGGGSSKSNYDRMGSDRVAGEMDMDDDVSSVRKKK